MFLYSLLDNCLWDVLLEIAANEHSHDSSVHLRVLSDFTDGKRLFRFAVKRTNVLSILCDSGHLSYRCPYGYTSLFTPLKLCMHRNTRKGQVDRHSTCTTALAPLTSNTCPLRLLPSASVRLTISANLGNCKNNVGILRKSYCKYCSPQYNLTLLCPG